MYIERNMVSDQYGGKIFDSDDEGKNVTVWVISAALSRPKTYTYDEAITLTGQGPYSVGLLLVCSLSLLAMGLDMFGFTVVVSGGACDLDIQPWQHNVLLSMPFLGAMSMAYLWGYISDTRGRRLSLLIAMWGSFLASILSIFSPHWIVLGALKFISASLCSCAQSATFTLVGECCPANLKRMYLFILTSVLHLIIPTYTALSYASFNMKFEVDLNGLTLTPWRLLTLLLALPLGISAVCLHFFYESPKFLCNIGKKALALEVLRSIWKINRCAGKRYTVTKLVLDEENNTRLKSVSFLQSLWEQTAPLIKPPLLLRTLQLYFLIIVMYSTTSSLIIWFPFLTNAFVAGSNSSEVGLCNVIEGSQNITDRDDTLNCVPKSDISVVWSSVAQGVILVIITIVTSRVSSRKLLVIVMTMTAALSSAGCAVIANDIVALILFYAIFLAIIVTGILSTYFVDLYPTSYRGMVACLSVFLARGSGLVGLNVTGLYILTYCSTTFYVIAGNLLFGVLVGCFLPSDKHK